MRTPSLFLLIGHFAFSVWADSFPKVGKVFPIGSDRKAILYNFKQTLDRDASGGEVLSTFFSQPDGRVVVVEEVRFAAGKLKRYQIEQKQEGYLNLLEITGNQASYRRTNQKTGDVENSTDDWGPDFLTVPQLMSYAAAHWDLISKGDSVAFRLSILEKMQTYGFKMVKDSESQLNGKPVVILKVKPTSLFISMVLSPFLLTVDPKTKKLLQISGSSLPKLEKGPNDLRDLEADMVYTAETIPRS